MTSQWHRKEFKSGGPRPATEPAKGHREKKLSSAHEKPSRALQMLFGLSCALDNFFSRDVPSRAPYPAPSAGNLFGVPLHFLGLQLQLFIFVSAFVMISTFWSVSCLMFFSRCPRAQPFVKVGASAPARHVARIVSLGGSFCVWGQTYFEYY